MDIEEIKKRLREGASFYHAPTTWNEAVDAIESLQRELRAASELSDSLFGDVECYCLKCCDLERELEEARKDAKELRDILRRDSNCLEIRMSQGDYHAMEILTLSKIDHSGNPQALISKIVTEMHHDLQAHITNSQQKDRT